MKKKYCKSCKRDTIWDKGVALLNSWWASADFSGDYVGSDMSKVNRGQTISRTGPPSLVAVEKCASCGRSVRAEVGGGFK